MDNAKLTPASAWKARSQEGEAVELPSGFIVRLRPVSMEYLFAHGKLSDALTPIVASMISTGQVAVTNIVEDAKSLIALKKLMCEASMVYPKIADKPDYDNGEVGYFDLSTEDTEFVMDWALRPQKDLSRFRKEQVRDVEPARNE